MDVPGLCPECGRPGLLEGCPLCGAPVCERCVAEARHRCQKRLGGRAPGRLMGP